MKPIDIIIIAVIVLIIGGAALYIYRAKKRGVKCIGCPNGASCGSGGCSSSAHVCEEQEGEQAPPADSVETACSGNCSCCSRCKQKR